MVSENFERQRGESLTRRKRRYIVASTEVCAAFRRDDLEPRALRTQASASRRLARNAGARRVAYLSHPSLSKRVRVPPLRIDIQGVPDISLQ